MSYQDIAAWGNTKLPYIERLYLMANTVNPSVLGDWDQDSTGRLSSEQASTGYPITLNGVELSKEQYTSEEFDRLLSTSLKRSSPAGILQIRQLTCQNGVFQPINSYVMEQLIEKGIFIMTDTASVCFNITCNEGNVILSASLNLKDINQVVIAKVTVILNGYFNGTRIYFPRDEITWKCSKANLPGVAILDDSFNPREVLENFDPKTIIATYMPFSLANQAMKLNSKIQADIASFLYKAKSLVGDQLLRQSAMEFETGKCFIPKAEQTAEISRAKTLYGRAYLAIMGPDACLARMGLTYFWYIDPAPHHYNAKKFTLCRALVEHGKEQYPRTFTDYHSLAELSRPQRLRFRIPPEVKLFNLIRQLWGLADNNQKIKDFIMKSDLFSNYSEKVDKACAAVLADDLSAIIETQNREKYPEHPAAIKIHDLYRHHGGYISRKADPSPHSPHLVTDEGYNTDDSDAEGFPTYQYRHQGRNTPVPGYRGEIGPSFVRPLTERPPPPITSKICERQKRALGIKEVGRSCTPTALENNSLSVDGHINHRRVNRGLLARFKQYITAPR